MRVSIALPPSSARALSKPNRELAPPASTYPARADVGLILFPFVLVMSHQSRFTFFVVRFPARPANAQFAQFFLQALAMQTDGNRGARDIPAMRDQLLGDPGDFEFAFGFAKIAFAHSGIAIPRAFFARARPAAVPFPAPTL